MESFLELFSSLFEWSLLREFLLRTPEKGTVFALLTCLPTPLSVCPFPYVFFTWSIIVLFVYLFVFTVCPPYQNVKLWGQELYLFHQCPLALWTVPGMWSASVNDEGMSECWTHHLPEFVCPPYEDIPTLWNILPYACFQWDAIHSNRRGSIEIIDKIDWINC